VAASPCQGGSFVCRSPAGQRQERFYGRSRSDRIGRRLSMTAWQYAQLTITRDIHAGEIQAIV